MPGGASSCIWVSVFDVVVGSFTFWPRRFVIIMVAGSLCGVERWRVKVPWLGDGKMVRDVYVGVEFFIDVGHRSIVTISEATDEQ